MKDTPIPTESKFAWEFEVQWMQLFSHYNWRTFSLIQLEVEDENLLGVANCTIALLGFRLYVAYRYQTTEFYEELDRRAKDFINVMESEDE